MVRMVRMGNGVDGEDCEGGEMVNGVEVVRWCTRVSVILIPGDNCEV